MPHLKSSGRYRRDCYLSQMELTEYLAGYRSGEITEDEVINVMVGDLQRIKMYPEKGFQVHQDIPKEVWDAYLKLVEMGYTKHLC